MSASILEYFARNLQTILKAEAYNFTISGILYQFHGKIFYSVAFLSHTMNEAKRNYDIHCKEMLTIVTYIKITHHYFKIIKHKIAIITNQDNLQYFVTTKVYDKCQTRRAKKVGELTFTIIYP